MEPVALPATVPTFHEEAGDIEAAAGVDVFDGMFGAGAVARAGSPSPFANKHGPPNAEELERFDPGEIFSRGVVEVEHNVVFGEADGRAGDHHHAPRCAEGQLNASLDAVGEGSDVGLESLPFVELEGHLAVVVKGGLVDGDVVAVFETDGERGVDGLF